MAISLAYAMHKLGTGEFDEGMDTLSDTLQGFGYVFRTEITEKRRSLLKPKLPEDPRFRQMPSNSNKFVG